MDGGSPAAQDGIHVGALLPYTGDLAASGPSLERGITLAIEAANRAGGIAGQPLIVDVEDTHSSVDRGRASADRLFARGISALIVWAASCCNPSITL